ncbi:MAG: glycosyltransferase family 4 protein [Candidatus Omnitrophota bacterium]|nr:glycosyltransferase family 4 protein [Candidatus Omnitrophota bacterium]MDZ4241388.1 glycosyltransferase family 4 protein [Candidatus Omnitrophota bacterium]
MSKERILICGILPPPNFGHSMVYKVLMASPFVEAFDIIFFDMRFWSYSKHKKVTPDKLLKFIQYYFQFIGLILWHRPRYVLYAMSFDKMPFLKDFVFCMTAWLFFREVILHDMGQYLRELYDSCGWGMRGLIRCFMRRVTASIVLGEATRAVYKGFLPMERVFAVPGAVEDTEEIKTAPAPLKPQDPHVLYFSFLSRSKGVMTALKAIPLVLAKNPHAHFTFAGPVESPQLLGEFSAFIQENLLQDRVKYVGYVGGEAERTAYFRSADIFMFPSHRDVFGLVLLHAMAERLPAVASREGAIPEIVEDGVNGFIFPKGDHEALAAKILELTGNKPLRERMGQAGREKYLRVYTPEAYGRRMIAAFESIMTLE